MTAQASPLKPPPLWWGLLCAVPVLSGLIGRGLRGTPGFEDFDAVTCAGITLLKGGDPYSLTPACAGLKSAVFVYAPPVLEGTAAIMRVIGPNGFRLLFGGLWLIALVILTAYALKYALPKVDMRLKLPMLALFTGGCIACGNIAILLHGVVLLGALFLPRRVLPFLIAVTLTSFVKPVMLTYLIVLAYMVRPLYWRAGWIAAGIIAGLGLSLWVLQADFPLSERWKATLDHIVLTNQTGISYFGWLSRLGVPSTSPLSLLLLPLVMIGLAVAGLAIVELGQLKTHARLVVGLGLAQLLNPRLMDYDLLLMVPYAALLAQLVARQGGHWPLLSRMGLIAIPGSILVLNAIEQRVILPIPLTLHLISLFTFALATACVFQQRAEILNAAIRLRYRLMRRLRPLPAAE